jgi:hypothetical protein
MFSLFNRNKTTEPTTPETPDITEEEIQSIYELAGGEARYKKIVRWAKTTMSDQYQDQFNEVIGSGDVLKIKEQTESLIRKWDTAYEADPEGTEDAAGIDPAAHLGMGIRDLLYKDEKYEGTNLSDRIIAMKMIMYFISKEHELILEEEDLDAEKKTMFEVDLNKLKAAMDIVKEV